MKIICGFENLPSISKNTITAIGNFDGIHLGHKKILEFLSKNADELGLFSMVLTFSPHPEKILGEKRKKMIQTLDQRLEEIKKFGIQAVLVISFDKKFSNFSGQEFIQKILVNLLRAKVLVVGKNFRFGKNREGDTSLLRRLASRFNLQVFSLPSVSKSGMIVSSSLIRKFLQDGEIEKANFLLGRTYGIEGEVIKGKSRGKILGFPTANIQTRNEIVPPGVFITNAEIGSKKIASLTNIGHCPTFGQQETNIESYIINFSKNLYGKKLRIYFIKKLREEIKFDTSEKLSQQIKKDLDTATKYFKILQ